MEPKLRVNFAGLAFGLFLLVLFVGPWLRGLFFEPDLLPTLVALAVALVLLALDAWNRNTPWWPTLTPPDWSLLALTALYFLSFFPAADRHAAMVGALRMAGYAAAYILAARYAQNPQGLKRLAWTIFVSGCGIALLGWLAAGQWVRFPGAFASGRLMSALQYPNALAGMLIVTLCVGAGLWAQSAGLPRALAAAGFILGLVTLLATFSRGGWLAYAAVAALMIVMAPQGRWWPLLLFHTAGGTLAAVLGARLLPALRSGLQPKHLLLFGVAALAFVIVDQLAYRVADRLRDRITNPTIYSLLRGALVAYVVALVAWTGIYFVQNSPTTARLLVPTDATARFATISGEERSFGSRLTTSRDAWQLALRRPLLGAGAGGWNALYHQVQETPYWMTEVHNHFMQTAVEVGLTGFLAFILLWVFLGLRTARTIRRSDDDQAMLVWGAAMGLLGLLLHAIGDFDLSLPALGLWVFALGGLLRGLDPKSRRKVRVRRGGTASPADPADPNGEHGARQEAPPLPPVAWERLPRGLQSPAVLLVVALLIAFPAWRLNSAGRVGAVAAQAFAQQDWSAAQQNYTEAHRLDPWNGSYALDLAQVNLVLAAQGLVDGEEVYSTLATALAVQPYRPDLRDRAVRLYLLLDEPDLALAQAKALAWLLPKQIQAHESYLELLAARAQRRLRDHQSEGAYDDITELLEARDHLLAVQRQVDLKRNPYRSPKERPVLSATLELAFARAEYLRGRPGPALAHLALIKTQAFDRPEELQALKAASRYLTGEGNLDDLNDMDETTRAIYSELLAIHGF